MKNCKEGRGFLKASVSDHCQACELGICDYWDFEKKCKSAFYYLLLKVVVYLILKSLYFIKSFKYALFIKNILVKPQTLPAAILTDFIPSSILFL